MLSPCDSVMFYTHKPIEFVVENVTKNGSGNGVVVIRLNGFKSEQELRRPSKSRPSSMPRMLTADSTVLNFSDRGDAVLKLTNASDLEVTYKVRKIFSRFFSIFEFSSHNLDKKVTRD